MYALVIGSWGYACSPEALEISELYVFNTQEDALNKLRRWAIGILEDQISDDLDDDEQKGVWKDAIEKLPFAGFNEVLEAVNAEDSYWVRIYEVDVP
jgi:hypothetical protein